MIVAIVRPLAAVEREAILIALIAHAGDTARAARALGCSRRKIQYAIGRYLPAVPALFDGDGRVSSNAAHRLSITEAARAALDAAS